MKEGQQVTVKTSIKQSHSILSNHLALYSAPSSMSPLWHSLDASTGVVFLNVSVSVGMIFISKFLFETSEISIWILTEAHLITISMGLLICRHWNIFLVRHIPPMDVVLFALLYACSVILTNSSLQQNNIYTYQVLKLLNFPLKEMRLYITESVDAKVLKLFRAFPMLLISTGAATVLYCEISSNYIGVLSGLMSALFTALHQQVVSRKQKQFQMNNLQLMYYQAPVAGALLLLIAPFFTKFRASFIGPMHLRVSREMGLLLLSCLGGFAVNLTMFYMLRSRTNNKWDVISEVKILILFALSFMLFPKQFAPLQIVGVIACVAGTCCYHFTPKRGSDLHFSKSN